MRKNVDLVENGNFAFVYSIKYVVGHKCYSDRCGVETPKIVSAADAPFLNLNHRGGHRYQIFAF